VLFWTGSSQYGCADPGGAIHECSSSEKAGGAAVIAGFWSGLGTWLGYRKQSEVWSDSPGERLRLTVRPERGGGRIALTLSF
jgi:hypothetical protein